MYEHRKYIPKAIEIIKIPSVPREVQLLSSQDLACMCKEQCLLPQVISFNGNVSVSVGTKHINNLKMIAPLCEEYQSIIIGLVHKFHLKNKKEIRIEMYVDSREGHTLDLYFKLEKVLDKKFDVSLKQRDEESYIEIIYAY